MKKMTYQLKKFNLLLFINFILFLNFYTLNVNSQNFSHIPNKMFTEKQQKELSNNPNVRHQIKAMEAHNNSPDAKTVKSLIDKFTDKLPSSWFKKDNISQDVMDLASSTHQMIIREFIEVFCPQITTVEREKYGKKLLDIFVTFAQNKMEKEKSEKDFYNMHSTKNRILIDFILRSIIVGLIEAPISDAYNYLIKKFRIHFFLNNIEENTYNFLSGISIRSIENLNLDTEKYTEVAAFSQQLVEFISKNHKIHVTNLILEGVSGTGKTSIGLAILDKILTTYKSSKKFKNWKNTIRRFIPRIIRSLFFIHKYEHIRIIYTSGSMLNEYKEEEAQVVLEKMLNNLLEYIRNHPYNLFVMVCDEGEIYLHHKYSTIIKAFFTNLDKLNNENSLLGKGKHGMGLIIFSTNHGNGDNVDGNISRRCISINFAVPSISTRVMVFISYIREYSRKDIYKNVYISEYLKNYLDYIIQFTDNFSHSDVENIVFLLFVHAVTYNTPITILDTLYTIRMEYIKRQVLVEHKKDKDIDNQKLSTLISDMETYIKNLWATVYNYNNNEKSMVIKKLLYEKILIPQNSLKNDSLKNKDSKKTNKKDRFLKFLNNKKTSLNLVKI
ncbi:hypothetical protein AB836_01510 [Rickettsiales bacterium (ex Bugula neritina AB1)]|nr:hypothetical protein AB836_01510 [Rickettsiales bacterium (ex Bugula neritina AB1)]